MKRIKLSIPKPCHENWEQMTPVEKGKFCAACKTSVLDFTEYSDRQLAQFLRHNKGEVCGRVQIRQIDRYLDLSPTISWRHKVAGIVMGLAVTLGFKSSSQAGAIKEKIENVIPINGSDDKGKIHKQIIQSGESQPDSSYIIAIKVIGGGSHAPLDRVNIGVSGMNKEFRTSVNGECSIEIPASRQNEITVITVEKPGFVTYTFEVGPLDGNICRNISLEPINFREIKMGKFAY